MVMVILVRAQVNWTKARLLFCHLIGLNLRFLDRRRLVEAHPPSMCSYALFFRPRLTLGVEV